jgi:AcrR family transcriptional regulator
MGSASSTKQRILGIARELFAQQGYTGTSIADIARELGTTTAALYYHFPSKADILRGLLAEPLAAYARILGGLQAREPTAEELLGAFIDLTADSRELAVIIDRDPVVLEMITEQLPESSQRMNEQVIAALAGPGADRAAIIRAHAAFGAVKNATIAAMSLHAAPDGSPHAAPDGSPHAAPDGDVKLDPADREEILQAALRALNP